LDELVAANTSEWISETVPHIINSRYNQKRVTLITTNLPLEGSSRDREVTAPSGEPIPNLERSLNQFGTTLCSRLYEMCKIIEISFSVEDYRKTVTRVGHKCIVVEIVRWDDE